MAPKQKGSAAQGRSKGKGGAGAGGNNNNNADLDGPQEEPLLGIILADSYTSANTSRFAPLDAATPTCLLPLAGAPILHWTIEALTRADVARIYILSTRHTSLLREHIKAHFGSGSSKNDDNKASASSSKSSAGGAFGFPPISALPIPQAGSVGDALRELDARQVVRASDFILVHADYVGNLDLAELVRAHKERRKSDRDAIMTVATMPSSSSSSSSFVAGDEGAALWGIDDSKGGQLRHYAHRPILAPSGTTGVSTKPSSDSVSAEGITLPWGLLSTDEEPVSDIDLYTNLVDCGVDICSMDVPPLFSENFDYQHLRRDFIPGILTSDLLTAKIFVHIAPSQPASVPVLGQSAFSSSGAAGAQQVCRGYGARVSSTKAYHGVSMDILDRWLYPHGPSSVLPGPLGSRSEGGYIVRPGSLYVHSSAHIFSEPQSEYKTGAKGLQHHQTLGTNVLLGPNSQVYASAHIRKSILESRVSVSSRSMVTGSILHEGVTIGKDCIISDSVLGAGVKVLDGVKIGRGSLIEAGVVLGPNIELREGSRIGIESAAAYDEEEDDDAQEDEDAKMTSSPGQASTGLGEKAVGHLWPYLGEGRRASGADDDDSDDEDNDGDDSAANNWRNVLLLRIGSRPQDAIRLASELKKDDIVPDDQIDSLSEEEYDDEAEEEEFDEDEEEDDDDTEGGDSRLPSARPSAMHSRTATSNALAHGTEWSNGGVADATVRRLLDFRSEACASLSRALAENHTLENASIELKTLRMASNVTLLELRATVLAFLMGKATRAMRGQSGQAAAAAFGKVWSRWGGLVRAVASEVPDQVQVVTLLQTYCATHPAATKLFVPTLKLFYNEDVVEDEAIIDWWRSTASRSAAPKGLSAPGFGVSAADEAGNDAEDEEDDEDEVEDAGEEEMKALRLTAEPVLRFILESQEDDDDDDEEEEEEEDD
ncbi:translation initiation factor eIF-2B epsilon subunit, GEF [Tilletia horrida]|uniref:Translation initiation factor eIF2B subunit epsilon n=1 Tax=Tilletia horrida TaxID=155126 RepID=A0AAN6GV11_9BASI|nr:translation initiation factor eIF-2B epsilon subunit, GEF [Tilletia horrida]